MEYFNKPDSIYVTVDKSTYMAKIRITDWIVINR